MICSWDELIARTIWGGTMGFLKLFIAGFGLLTAGVIVSAQTKSEVWMPSIPEPLIGPYIVDPEILANLDKTDPDCSNAGHLNFQCLVYQDERAEMKTEQLQSNPFEIDVFNLVRETVKNDLASIKKYPQFGGDSVVSLSPGFLSYDGAKVELVGVINRMDRAFVPDKVPARGVKSPCGEISVIYRFGYEGDLPQEVTGERHYQSRLPITMNIIFPAIPWSGDLTCTQVAQRWLDYVDSVKEGKSGEEQRANAKLVVSSLRAEDIDRIELNMQGSRVPGSGDMTNFGTLGTYIIRVFRWAPDERLWKPSYLLNQIDRARFFDAKGDDNSCVDRQGTKLSRKALVDFVSDPKQIADIDNGLVIIDRSFLACRAISVSPGGASRSGNQPFWNARDAAGQTLDSQQLLYDSEIDEAIANYKKNPKNTLSFIGNAEEFRTRLNDTSCSGCHQTRAIAGFHFPGADRSDISSVNAVFLPGSPHFFGDQLRRIEILKVMASGQEASRRTLATSYTARPQNRFAALKPSSAPREKNVQLIGGWGGACLSAAPAKGIRSWGCSAGLQCKPVFASTNDPGIGMCVNPAERPEIGEAMQFGNVVSFKFGFDKYWRIPAVKNGPDGKPDTRISTDHLNAPTDNSYLAAHQEFYVGDLRAQQSGETDKEYAVRFRNQSTGGFPAGYLRLSECNGLKDEATCALLASSGFNSCLSQVGKGQRTPESCFRIYTSYAGARACDPANPCRDDYICLRPAGYTAANAGALFEQRYNARLNAIDDPLELSANRFALQMKYRFGELMPDAAWLGRNGGRGDRRGICIPPYFVFQFKADGHVVPQQKHPAEGH